VCQADRPADNVSRVAVDLVDRGRVNLERDLDRVDRVDLERERG
jgi:hypothetical protein